MRRRYVQTFLVRTYSEMRNLSQEFWAGITDRLVVRRQQVEKMLEDSAKASVLARSLPLLQK